MSKVRRKDALEFHRAGRPGKIQVVPTKPLTSQRDLSLAYSPGVAEPCLEIAKDPDAAFEYTARGNLVAVISNGTAVLGLGDIGALASKPVMEGKGVLFKKFADIDVFDIEVDEKDPDRFIEVVAALEPTFGGINLEDIAAPECFYIERELKKRMRIPVFHDDQHGTAIISGAALINAAELQGKKIDEIKMVVSGAGASAISCTRFYLQLGVKPENVLMCDRHGVLYTGREDMDDTKIEFARDTECRTLADALVGADLFLGLSKGGVANGEMIAKMNDKPIIFALANPIPEIGYEEAKEARPDAIVATGRSDYDNQVNNVLGFPGIFRGALDVRATDINEAMKIAAAHALAELTRKDVPRSVNRAYGSDFQFGPNYIIPKPFDPRVVESVAPAVAKAAMESGVATVHVDLKAYAERIRRLKGGSTEILRRFARIAQSSPRRIVFPEAEEARILGACAILVDERIARPVLLGDPAKIRSVVEAHEIELDLDAVEIVDPRTDGRRDHYVGLLHRRRERKGMDRGRAEELMNEPNHFGMMMVEQGHADGIVSGFAHSYPEVIRPALQIIGLKEGFTRAAGTYLMMHRNGLMFFADTTVNTRFDAESLADVAEMVADSAQHSFDTFPRVALLSYSNFGSARSEESEMVARAAALLRARRPDLEVEGEMQANVAVDYELQKRNFPFTRLSGPANVLVFPSLEAGNAAYKLMRTLGDVRAVGPVLLGTAKPVNILERDCDLDNIVHMAVLTVVEAQAASRGHDAAEVR